MKKFLLAVAALACMGSVALAGPNALGTLIAHNPGIPYGAGDPCLDNPLSACEAAVVRTDGTVGGNAMILRVYAAFLPGTVPDLQLLTWGITYPPQLALLDKGICCDYEFNDPNAWPQSGSGNSTGWNQGNSQHGLLIPVYWFAMYTYGDPGLFQLGPNPDPVLGGLFYDSSTPAQTDAIACYGAMGFDMDGVLCCPVQATGACCIGDACIVVPPAQCQGTYLGDGTVCEPTTCLPGACCEGQVCFITYELLCQPPLIWKGAGVLCDPNPCIPPTPTENSSWGQIKNSYR